MNDLTNEEEEMVESHVMDALFENESESPRFIVYHPEQPVVPKPTEVVHPVNDELITHWTTSVAQLCTIIQSLYWLPRIAWDLEGAARELSGYEKFKCALLVLVVWSGGWTLLNAAFGRSC